MSGVGVSKAVHNMCQQAGRPAGGRSDSGQVTAPETPGTPRRPHLRNKLDMGLAPGHEILGKRSNRFNLNENHDLETRVCAISIL